jgi:hypothetical protein
VGEDKNQPWEEVKESNGTHRPLDHPWNAYDSTVLVIWGRGGGCKTNLCKFQRRRRGRGHEAIETDHWSERDLLLRGDVTIRQDQSLNQLPRRREDRRGTGEDGILSISIR